MKITHINDFDTFQNASGSFDFLKSSIVIPTVDTLPVPTTSGQMVFVAPSGKLAIAHDLTTWKTHQLA